MAEACPHCGHDVPEGAAFCPKCGRAVRSMAEDVTLAGGATAPPGTPVAPPPAATPPPAAAAPPQPPGPPAPPAPGGPATVGPGAPTQAGPGHPAQGLPTFAPAGGPAFAGPPAAGKGKLVAGLVGGAVMIVILAVVAFLLLREDEKGPPRGGGNGGKTENGDSIVVEGESRTLTIPRQVGRFTSRGVQPAPALIQDGAGAAAIITYRTPDDIELALIVGGFDSNDTALKAALNVGRRLENDGFRAEKRQGGGFFFRKEGAEILVIVERQNAAGTLLAIGSAPGVPAEFYAGIS